MRSVSRLTIYLILREKIKPKHEEFLRALANADTDEQDEILDRLNELSEHREELFRQMKTRLSNSSEKGMKK